MSWENEVETYSTYRWTIGLQLRQIQQVEYRFGP